MPINADQKILMGKYTCRLGDCNAENLEQAASLFGRGHPISDNLLRLVDDMRASGVDTVDEFAAIPQAACGW